MYPLTELRKTDPELAKALAGAEPTTQQNRADCFGEFHSLAVMEAAEVVLQQYAEGTLGTATMVDVVWILRRTLPSSAKNCLEQNMSMFSPQVHRRIQPSILPVLALGTLC